MVLQPSGRSTNFQVLLDIRDFISSFIVSFQNIASGDVKAIFFFKFLGIFLNVKNIIIRTKIIFNSSSFTPRFHFKIFLIL